MNLFDFFNPNKKKANPKQKKEFTFNYGAWQDYNQKTFQKAVNDYDEAKKEAYQLRIKLLPAYSLMYYFYDSIPAVSASVNFKANLLARGWQKGWEIRDINGYRVNNLTKYIEYKYNITNDIEKASKQLDLYGICFDAEFARGKDDAYYKLIPANELSAIYVNPDTFEIINLSWDNSDVFYYKNITRYDLKGNLNFSTVSIEDPSDMFLGALRIGAMNDLLKVLDLDNENLLRFLKQAAFPGVIALVDGEYVQQEDIQKALANLNEKNTRFKPQTIENAFNEAGGSNVEFVTVKQQMENRLTDEEKKEVDGKIFDNLQIPRKLMGMSTSGMGANEYQTALNDFVLRAYDPQRLKIENLFNSFRIPKILERLEKDGYFEDYKITVDGEERQATKDDFIFCIKDLETESAEVRRQSWIDLMKAGGATVADAKIRGFDIREDEVEDDDQVYLQPQNLNIIKRGQRREKEQIETSQGKVDLIGEEVAEEETEEIEEGETTQEVIEETEKAKKIKSLNQLFSEEYSFARLNRWNKGAKRRKQLKSFFEKATGNIVEESLKSKTKKDLVKDFNLAFKKSYNVNIKKLAQAKQQGMLEVEAFKQVKPIKDSLDYLAVTDKLAIFAKIGQKDILNQFEEQTGDNVSPETRKALDKALSKAINIRVSNLLGLDEVREKATTDQVLKEIEEELKKEENEINWSILMPLLLQVLLPYQDNLSLDTTTQNQLISIFNQLTDDEILEIINDNEAVISEVEQKILDKIDERSELVGDDNASSLIAVGQLLTASFLGAKTKTWIRTTSAEPRMSHLQTAGTTIGFYQYFTHSDGTVQFWSQESINCKCSIKVNFI